MSAHPLRIAIVAENHPLVLMGGAEYQTQLLTEELCIRPGAVVSYFARRVPPPQQADTLPYAVHRIGSDSGPLRRRAVIFDAATLFRALQSFRPHVIYQQAKQSYTAVCARYAGTARIPFFFHIASDADLDRRWLSLRPSFNTPFDLLEDLTGNWGIAHASHVIVQTEPQAALLQRRFGRSDSILIRNFQPLPAALPRKPDGPLKILWVANLKPVKRPELFVELAQRFAGRTDLEFQMVGRGSTNRRDVALMRSLTTVANLHYSGEMPMDEVNRLMAEAAMHVNTSSFEGFPNTFIQAWARGAAVLSLAVDPNHNLESAGIGYCAGSMSRLVQLVDTLASNPELRRSTAERAFAYAHENHSLQSARQLADLMLAAAHKSTAAAP